MFDHDETEERRVGLSHRGDVSAHGNLSASATPSGRPVGPDLLERHRAHLAARVLSEPAPRRTRKVRACPRGGAQVGAFSAEVAALAAAVQRVHAIDAAGLSVDDARALLVGLEAARRSLEAAVCESVAAIDRLGTIEADEGLRSTTWAARATHGARATWARRRRLGRVMVDFAGFARAVATGSLGIEHVEAIAAVLNDRNRDALVEVERNLLVIAHHSSFEEFRRQVARLARLADGDGSEPDCRRLDSAALSADGGGGVHLRGSFSGHQAAVIAEAVNREMLEQHRCAVADQRAGGDPVPATEVLRARAVFELIRRGAAVGPSEGTAPRVETVIVFHHDDSRAPFRVADGEPLSPATVELLTCDADHHAVVLGAGGSPLWSGRRFRHATRGIRRALAARDGGCAFPGCDAPPSWCDAHHVRHWTDGGATDPDNLVLLCRSHHGLAHSSAWDLLVEPVPADGRGPTDPRVRFVWVTPRGGHMECQRADTR